MTIAVFPGSFDPITLGHMDIATRARAFADDVVLAVGVNASKSYVFDFAQRLALAQEAVKGIDGVRVAPMPGLLVDLCRELGANIIVKGLRSEADFSAEWPMALMNRHLTGIETAFILADPALTHVASSLVKDVARHGGDVTDLVPPGVAEAFSTIHRIEE